MFNDDLDLSGPTKTQVRPSGSAATPTSRPKKFTSDVWQCFDIVQMTLPDGTTGPRAKCFYNMKIVEIGRPQAQALTSNDWYVARVFVEFLKIFYNSIITLSGVYYLTSSQFIGTNLTVDYSEQITDIRNKLFEVFSIYERRFGGVYMQPSTEPETQPMQTSWSILKRRKKDKSSSSSPAQRSAASSRAELNKYLEAQFDVCEDTEKFDLLLWWKTYSYRYPVRSHLARDILVIPVSTVSSEQAFSTSKQIIEPRRSCLTPKTVEVLTCVRDWKHSRKRLQNETVDEEFIQNFSNLYVDESSGSNQVQN
ncbi:hypothetical protein Dsin_006659 [Dipteronia sinensis]|uniref:HAT C-terminal dimerisation domain-containing protein n=1 Tax=Dipteronia sinensis TaxID=43782 RepID=A0AAE0B008_9ROSI|nr:hypothetical protein Dsin_006659 [Dipteronia sinensis]